VEARGKLRRAALAVLVAIALPVLTGCEIKMFTVEILGWDAYQVQGVWLWRYDQAAGRYQRDNGIQFHRDQPTTQYQEQFPPGTELVLYTYAGDGSEMPASVQRDPNDPDRVTLQLWYLRFSEPGVFKASTYNAAGESVLSSGSILL
jgi:hypothetical protein